MLVLQTERGAARVNGQNNNKQVYICRCEEVTEEEILKAIEEGAVTLNGIKKRTYAGMGLCQGNICRHLISRLLSSRKKPAEIFPPTSRSPVRAVEIGVFIRGDE